MKTPICTDSLIPPDRDWSGWVSATQTRNWMKKDPLLDWLELYGSEKEEGRRRDFVAHPDPMRISPLVDSVR